MSRHSSRKTDNGDITGRGYRRATARYRAKCEAYAVPCHLCGDKIRYDAPAGDPDSFQLDHFHPRSTHPELTNDPANWRPSHASCNKSRGNKDVRPILGVPSREW